MRAIVVVSVLLVAFSLPLVAVMAQSSSPSGAAPTASPPSAPAPSIPFPSGSLPTVPGLPTLPTSDIYLLETKLSVTGARDDRDSFGGGPVAHFAYSQNAEYSLIGSGNDWGLSPPDFARIMYGLQPPPAKKGGTGTSKFPPDIAVTGGGGEYHWRCNNGEKKGTVPLNTPRAGKSGGVLAVSRCTADDSLLFWYEPNEGLLDQPPSCAPGFEKGTTQRGLNGTFAAASEAAFKRACPTARKQTGLFMGKLLLEKLQEGQFLPLPASFAKESDKVDIDLQVRILPRLKADAGGPYAVERGAKVKLDGSRSIGSIKTFSWKLSPASGCPAGVPSKTVSGKTLAVTLLCPMTATLTVSDGSATDTSAAVPLGVTARTWKTDFPKNVVKASPQAHLRVGCAVGECAFGRNSCALHGTFDTVDIVHNADPISSYEGDAFVLAKVDDRNSPFHGWTWVKENRSRIHRTSFVNSELVAGSLTARANAGSQDYAALVASVQDHEQFHSDVFREQLAQHGDPAKKTEKLIGSSRSAVLRQANELYFKLSEHFSNQHAGNEQKVHERMQAKWNRKVKLRLRQGESQTKFGVYDFGGRKLADLGD